MMIDSGVKLAGGAERAAELTAQAVGRHGMRMVRSFELRDALETGHIPCPCGHHGTDRCSCNYMVLSVYGAEPGTGEDLVGQVVIHSFEGSTWIGVPGSPSRYGAPEPAPHPQLLKALAEVVLISGFREGEALP